MSAYYNEIDPFAAQWLRNLIAAGHIAPGDVDERSIEDVVPSDLAGYRQCHFFAGIGVWSYALRNAGWPDDLPVWTGSCPCPPFSAAGKGSECPGCGGKSCLSHPVVTAGWLCLDCGDEWRGDDRHLLPEFIRLIGECGPSITFGEQVASRDGRLWLYTLRSVLETLGHAVGAADTCSAGSGAPHIRQRLRFVAERVGNAGSERWQRRRSSEACGQEAFTAVGRSGDAEWLENSKLPTQSRQRSFGGSGLREQEAMRPSRRSLDDGLDVPRDSARLLYRQNDGLADAAISGRREERADAGRQSAGDRTQGLAAGFSASSRALRPGPTNGFWRDADWLFCRDGRWRPVEPGTFPLAHGAPARVGRLRAYGNAVDAEATKHFIQAYIETERLRLTEMSAMTTDNAGAFG